MAKTTKRLQILVAHGGFQLSRNLLVLELTVLSSFVPSGNS